MSNFRELALHRNPAIVHATTGIGYEMIGALNGLQSRLIYGTHFWRDMFHGSGSFENIDINGRIRGEFGLLCARVDQAYANSVYTRDAIRTHFGMSQPIVYSLPFDAAGNDNISKPGEYVLLMNGRPDKGLNIALQAAARLPNVPFKIVASQVSAERVESDS